MTRVPSDSYVLPGQINHSDTGHGGLVHNPSAAHSRKPSLTKGWGWPFNAKMAHYFADGHSLCGYWEVKGTTITREHVPGPRPCTLCTEKLGKLR